MPTIIEADSILFGRKARPKKVQAQVISRTNYFRRKSAYVGFVEGIGSRILPERQLSSACELGLLERKMPLCASECGSVTLKCRSDGLLSLVVEVAAEQRSLTGVERVRAIARCGGRVERGGTHVHRVRGVQSAEVLVRVRRREVLVAIAVEQRVIVVLLERRRRGQLEDVGPSHRRAACGRLGAVVCSNLCQWSPRAPPPPT